MSYSRKFRLPSFGAVFHLVGVLGAGMLPLARLLISRGYVVSGSDLRSPEGDLPQGLKFTQGHSPESVASADVCVFSLAVPEDAPELRRAVELGIPKVSRPELLGVVVESFPKSIAVAGSHGKSSVTAMLAALFECSNPTVLCGADIGDDGFIEGSGELLIYEACEYRDAFLSTRPTCAVLLNLELDHTDYFRNISALEASFSRFAAASAIGRAVKCDTTASTSAENRPVNPRKIPRTTRFSLSFNFIFPPFCASLCSRTDAWHCICRSEEPGHS